LGARPAGGAAGDARDDSRRHGIVRARARYARHRDPAGRARAHPRPVARLEPSHGQVHVRDARAPRVRLRARRRRERAGDRAPGRGASPSAEVLPRPGEPRRRRAPAPRRHRRLARPARDTRMIPHMINVRLVPPSVWEPEVARYAGPGSTSDPWTDPARLAHATLWTLQDAHVGITPKLAHELGRLFARKGPVEPGVWPKLFRRLQERLPRTERSGLVAGSAPVYVVQNIVKPIVREACAELGYTCLLCQDDTDGAVTADEYAAYGSGLERIASRIAARFAEGPLFAAEHGNVIAALSEPSPHGRSRALVPEIDRDSLALLLGLDADVDFPERASRSTPTPSYVPKRRPAMEGQGGRVEGLRQGRGEGQLGSMVL